MRALRLHELITGYWMSQAVYVCAKLGIADRLNDGAQSAEALAAATGTHSDALRRLLRALANRGVLSTLPDGRFGLTKLGKLLRSGDPLSLNAWALYNGEAFHWRPWSELLYCVRTGRSGTSKVFESGFFDMLAKERGAQAIFDAAMAAVTNAQSALLLDTFDFHRYRTIVDVGGGAGDLLCAILQAHPKSRGVLYDLETVIARAASGVASRGLAQRCALVPGTFLERVPEGGDLYVLKQVLHDWPDDLALKILRNCRGSMADGSVLVLIEMVMPTGAHASMAKLVDLEMLVCTGGRERTAAEYRDLLARAGMRMLKVHSGLAPLDVIEAVAV